MMGHLMQAVLRTIRVLAVCLAAAGAGTALLAQSVEFGGLKADPSQPVEVTSDSLSVNQGDGTATFAGNVIVVQGDMRLSAAEVRVEYSADGKAIQRLHATGGVLLAGATEAAEAAEAVYTIGTGEVVMKGNVLLTQGGNAISGQTLIVDLATGQGRMEGRVTTTFTPGKN